MPRNGSGTYQLPAGNPVVTGTTISSSGWANPTLSDIAAALSASIAVDGQTVPTANLPMGNFRHLNVANGQNPNEYATVGQIQTAGFQLLGGTAGTINTTQPITTTQGISVGTSVTAGTSMTVGTTLTVNGSSTVKALQSSGINIVPTTGAQGQLQLNQAVSGPSSTFLRARLNGGWEFINSAYTGAIVSSDDSGNLIAQGNITAFSDERLKCDWADVPKDFVERLSHVTAGTYTRRDSGSRDAGSSAQDWLALMPEVVEIDDQTGYYSLAYGNAALVACVALARRVLALEALIKDGHK
jgi:hypothetical protein